MKIFAANDSVYTNKGGRSSPIKESLTSLKNYPDKLKIYKIRASKSWQVRFYIDGKYIVKSLKTENKIDALQKAKCFYDSCIEMKSIDTSKTEHSIKLLIEILRKKEFMRSQNGEISAQTVKVINSNLNRNIKKYFQNKNIEQIGEEEILLFLEFLKNNKLKPISIAQNLTTLKKLFNIAVIKKWITVVPNFPVVKKTTIPRGGFTVKEYFNILRTASKLIKTPPILKIKNHKYTKGGIFDKDAVLPYEFKWLIQFMVNSFVRPVDIKIIKHKHIQIVKNKHAYLRITLPETKLHTGQIITLPAAVHVYEKLREYFLNKNLASPENYLFMPLIENRSAAMSLMDSHFKKILTAADLVLGVRGQVRTLYSLRHTSITFRLLYGKGIDLLTLAKNARTSVEMIEKHYASELTAEMNVDMLHSRR